MKKTFLLFLLAVSSNFLAAQNLVIDSLKRVLQSQNDDTNKVNTQNELSLLYLHVNDYDNAFKCAENALSLSEKINFRKGKAKAFYNKAGVYSNQYNYSKALENYNSELRILEETKDTFTIAWTHVMIARVYFWMENFPEAQKHYYDALKVFEEKADKRSIAVALSEVGGINAAQKNNAEALKNYQEALKLSEELGLMWGVAGCYSSMADIHLQDYNYSEALRKDSIALKIFWEFKDVGNTGKRNGAAVLWHIASILEKLASIDASNKKKKEATNKYAEAIEKYSMAMKIFEGFGDRDGVAWSSMSIGKINVELRNLSAAKMFLDKSWLIADSIGSKSILKDTYLSLATLDSLKNNYAKAFEHYKMYIIYRDSLFNQENTKKLVQSQMQYDFDKKESLTKADQEKKDAIAQKELQKQKLVRNGFVGGFAVVLLFAGIFFNQRNKIKIGKQRSDELLLNILPEEVAEELKAKGSADAKQFNDVTVMFTDFKNFTQISEKLSSLFLYP